MTWLKRLQKRLLNVLTIWIREDILVIRKGLYISRNKCVYFYCLLNKHEMFHLFRLCLQRFMENICTTHPRETVFMARNVMALMGIFSIFPQAGLINFIVFLQVCHWISKPWFYSTEILLFVLIPRYCCFRVTYVWRCNMYICNHENNVPSRLSPQSLCGNSFTWAHDVWFVHYVYHMHKCMSCHKATMVIPDRVH